MGRGGAKTQKIFNFLAKFWKHLVFLAQLWLKMNISWIHSNWNRDFSQESLEENFSRLCCWNWKKSEPTYINGLIFYLKQNTFIIIGNNKMLEQRLHSLLVDTPGAGLV